MTADARDLDVVLMRASELLRAGVRRHATDYRGADLTGAPGALVVLALATT